MMRRIDLFPVDGILSGKDYEDQEENRSFQLRYFASFTVNFVRFFFAEDYQDDKKLISPSV